MIKLILIGGTPRCGKTTLAQKLSKDLGIPWISTDALESIAHQYTCENEENVLFPKTALRRKTNRSNDEMYSTFSTKEIVDAYIKQADTTGKAIEALVEYSASEGWSYVIEGYHVTPSLLKKLKKKNPEITAVILVNTNPDEVIERSINSDAKNDWMRDKTTNNDTYSKIGSMISLYSEVLTEEAQKLGVDIIDMGHDFQINFDSAYFLLTQNNFQLPPPNRAL